MFHVGRSRVLELEEWNFRRLEKWKMEFWKDGRIDSGKAGIRQRESENAMN